MRKLLAPAVPALFALACSLAACSGDEARNESRASAGASGSGGSAAAGSAGSQSGGASSGGSATAGSGGMSSAGSAGTSGTSGGGSAGSGGQSNDVVDASSALQKHLFGYQGWFACPSDGSQPDRWVHWFSGNPPDATNATFDLWPDLSELGDDELFATDMTLSGGAPARLYSAFTQKTVVRHFTWMRDSGIDGVMLQRFLSELGDPAFLALRDQVLANVRAGAEQEGRVFAVMYDISGASASTLVEDLKNDWHYLVDTLKVTESARYLHHAGKPLLAIWGFGFDGRPVTAAQAQELIDYLQSDADAKYQVTLMGGVPSNWRTLDGDAATDSAWTNVYHSLDIVSPWAVGRFADDAGADNFRTNRIELDVAELTPLGIDYMPVVFPGFSWKNLNDGPLNQIPRHGGAFYWHQAYNAIDAGATMLYTAMFDEVDEGTAMFKLAPSSADLPEQGTFLSLDADGLTLPSDWYLRVGGAASEMLRGDIALTDTVPISP